MWTSRPPQLLTIDLPFGCVKKRLDASWGAGDNAASHGWQHRPAAQSRRIVAILRTAGNGRIPPTDRTGAIGAVESGTIASSLQPVTAFRLTGRSCQPW